MNMLKKLWVRYTVRKLPHKLKDTVLHEMLCILFKIEVPVVYSFTEE